MSTLADKTSNPVIQALLTLSGVFIFILLSKLVALTGLTTVSDRFPWLTAASFLLLFSLFNAVGSIFAQSSTRYWRLSIYSFIGLAFSSALLAYLFSSLTISEAGSYRWIFFVVTFGYLVFISIMNIARVIVNFAQREEWNHPRIRQKKR